MHSPACRTEHICGPRWRSTGRSKRDGRPFGLLVIDLNHFKEINDTLGHHVGDQLLIQFAERLASAVRNSDHVARFGGDEFAVIVPNADEHGARAVAQRIQASLVQPIALEGMQLSVEAAIGIALHPLHAVQPMTCSAWPTSRCTWPRSLTPMSSRTRHGPRPQFRRAAGAAQ